VRRYKSEDVEYLFMTFKIADSTHVYNAVVNTFKTGGFQLAEDGDRFNCVWNGYTKPEEIAPLNKYQKINHFPNSVYLGRKDKCWYQLWQFQQRFGKEMEVAPKSWVLPEEFDQFERDKEAEDPE